MAGATVGGVWLISSVEQPAPAAVEPPPAPVAVMLVEPRSFTHEVDALGTVQALREAALGARVAGPVARIADGIELGTAVERGALLAQVDPTPFRIEAGHREALLARARARVESVEIDVGRQQTLISINRDKLRLAGAEQERLARLARDGLIALQDVERAELGVRRVEEELERAESGLREARAELVVVRAEVAAAEADLARARQGLADTEVRAPFTGVISEKIATLGEQVAPGMVLFRLADVSTVKLLVRIAAETVPLLAPGAVARVEVEGFAEPLAGRVGHVGPRADAETRTFPVEILVHNRGAQRLLPGMFARARMPVRTYDRAVLVPRSSVVRRDGSAVVFVAEPEAGLARRRPVVIGGTFGTRYLVDRGLAPGDLLVVRGQHLLEDGGRLAVVETLRAEP